VADAVIEPAYILPTCRRFAHLPENPIGALYGEHAKTDRASDAEKSFRATNLVGRRHWVAYFEG
jgi:hypothetical protein